MSASFEKWEALGNDFVVVRDSLHPVEFWQLRAPALCDRHRGVGADGILLIDSSVPSMTVVNADGSVSEMCGNGIRCVVGSLLEEGSGTTDGELRLKSGAGWHRCSASRESASGWVVRVSMGTPSFEPADAFAETGVGPLQPVSTAVGPGYVASIGNPHLVLFDPLVGLDPSGAGADLERDGRFKRRTNVEFVTDRDDGGFDVVVWERGVGLTQACGSGAVCVAAVAVGRGRRPANTPIALHLPGGVLSCTVSEAGEVTMTGPARRVFVGQLAEL